MATPQPDTNDESPSNHPPVITCPPTCPRTHLPQITQSQMPNSPVVNNNFNNTLDDVDDYLHYHDLDFVHQTPQRPEPTTTVPIEPIVYSPEHANICGKAALANCCAKVKKKRAAGRNQMESMHKRQKRLSVTPL